MTGSPPLPSFAALVVAAGKGLRAGGGSPKQYRTWRGRPMICHSVAALIAAGAEPVLVIVAEDMFNEAQKALEGCETFRLIAGGATRQQSVRAGLEALADDAPARVLIHDAARPDLPLNVIQGVLNALDRSPGAIPVLPVVDSVVVAGEDALMEARADRDRLRRVQTPQGFRFADILSAHREWADAPDAGDDAQVLKATGGAVALVEGDERLRKITFAADFTGAPHHPAFRIGQGFDVHRLERGAQLCLCGVQLDHEFGLTGHSDADVALHAVTDAILGAIGEGDIGTHFPPSDPQWAGAASGRFLEHAVGLAHEAGYAIGNIDLTIICEAPKIGPHRPAMRFKLAQLAGIDERAVSIKATTTEKLGFTGRGEGIAAQAVVALETV